MKLKPGITVNVGRHTFADEIPDEYAGSVPAEFLDDDKPAATSRKRSGNNSGGDVVPASESDSSGRTDI